MPPDRIYPVLASPRAILVAETRSDLKGSIDDLRQPEFHPIW
jgi:hypothetical protein